MPIHPEPSRRRRRAYFIADVPVRHHRRGRQRRRRSDRASRVGPKDHSRTSRPNGDDVEVIFRPDEELSERVIFPITDAQANGIEDARFVEFNDDGRKTFYATYTAYSGRAIRSELLETTDFRSFRMTPLGGSAARNKGMALFPRKIDGRYAMIGRQDNENLYLIYSDDLYTWEGGRRIPSARISLGVRADRQLWLTHRVGRLLAAADPRGRPGQEIFDRRGSPGQEGSLQGSRALARALVRPEPPNAKVMCPTSSIPAAPCVTATRSSCLMRCPTPSPISRRSRPEPCCGRWWGETSPLPVRNMLAQLGIPRSTFYAWCGQYLTGRPRCPRGSQAASRTAIWQGLV